MNTREIKADWSEKKLKLKEIYPTLTDADLFCEKGQEQDMLRMVAYKIRKTKDEMNEIVEKL